MKQTLAVLAALLLLTGSADAQELEYENFRARNRVQIRHAILLPPDYDSERSYPAAVVFPDGDMEQGAAERMLTQFWPTEEDRAGWIVLVPLVPGDDWRTHPNHHALNDLMDVVKERHSIKDDLFHIVGFGEEGAEVAATWASMSQEYFQSLTTLSGSPWNPYREFDGWKSHGMDRLSILMVVGANDAQGLESVRKAQTSLSENDLPFKLQILDGEGKRLPSMAGGHLFSLMADEFAADRQGRR